VFKARGRYESALIYALTAPRTNLAHVPRSVLALLIENADRAALRAAGDPLPHPGPFTVYRGVAGRGGARRVRGLSWTFSLPVAAWFARRFDLPDPAVYRVTVDEAHVLAYVSDREEEELLLVLPEDAWPKRCLMGAELTNAAEARETAMRTKRQGELAAISNKRKALGVDPLAQQQESGS